MSKPVDEINKLIADEVEAIIGYDEAIKKFENNDQIVEKLKEIKGDEQEHIKELVSLLNVLKNNENNSNTDLS